MNGHDYHWTAWECPRVIDNREKRSKDYYYNLSKDKDRIPDYLICNGSMSRIYIREIESPGLNNETKQYQKVRKRFQPIGMYCRTCGLFCKDEEYPELLKYLSEIVERDINNDYKHHIGYYKAPQ